MEIAKRLKPFGVKILATKRNWSLGSLPCGKLLLISGPHENSLHAPPVTSNIPCADVDGLVDKKGGPEDMYELAGEADIVITCLLQTNETVSSPLGLFLSLFYTDSLLSTLVTKQAYL
jgi:hypothetical protein